MYVVPRDTEKADNAQTQRWNNRGAEGDGEGGGGRYEIKEGSDERLR
jgi:hypothetical protein